MSLTVMAPGMLTLVQDAGRPGHGSVGVSRSGAFDRTAYRQANALVGNDEAPALEVAGGGLVLRADEDHLMAVTGGVGPLTVDGDPVSHGRALHVAAGRTLTLGTITSGLRAYVSVAGGFDVRHDLDSASTDVLSGLGPPPVSAGDVLRTARSIGPAVDGSDVPSLLRTGDHEVEVTLGPRDTWFTPEALHVFLTSSWSVSPESNRVGTRLVGPQIDRRRTDELPSEPCVRGSIQVSADGVPIVFGPDHPVTGGYPVIAVVSDSDVDQFAQARPGETVRFRRRPNASGRG